MLPRRNLPWSSLAAISVFLSVGPIGIVAQYTEATCLPSFGWMNNSKGQIPCLVGAYLQEVCNGGNFTVPALPLGYHYAGPTASGQNQCACSSVTYNTISACGLCQNQTIISWSTWKANCSSSYLGVFPLDIPDGTAVPQWAFQDVATSDMFDPMLAQAVGDSLESTATHVQSTISVIVSSTAILASTTSLPSATGSTQTSPGRASNTGAIAGGVVGAIFGVVLIITAIFFVIWRKQRFQNPSFVQSSNTRTSHLATDHTASTSFVPQMTHPKLYDPSDPTTFPPPAPLSPLTRTSGSLHGTPISANYSTPSLRPGAYNTR